MRSSTVIVRTAALVLAALGLGAHPAAAQPALPDVEELVQPAAPEPASYQDERRVARRYLVPALEVVGLDVIGNLGARIVGVAWADVTPTTMWRNLTHAWAYDDDLFSVDQLAHPYEGALSFSAARAHGHGFWVAAAYATAGSLLWEGLGETEPPAINDLITTSVAGTFLGEVLYRWSRAVRWGGGPRPSLGRRALASVIDPIGAANLAGFGEAWRRTPPPRLHAFMAAGLALPLGPTPSGPFYAELAVAHGLASDPRFTPRAPFDHFDLRVQLGFGTDGVTGYVAARGLLVGAAIGAPRRRALWGLAGTYDYWDADGVRASAIGAGPGVAVHVGLGGRDALALAGVVALVPWGAAGGQGDVEGVRDYHHGPGVAELVELKLSRGGLGVLRLSGRAIEIDGSLDGEPREVVVVTAAGAMLALGRHQALGLEVVYAAHHASRADAATTPFDQAAQLRLVYAVTSGSDFGGAPSP